MTTAIACAATFASVAEHTTPFRANHAIARRPVLPTLMGANICGKGLALFTVRLPAFGTEVIVGNSWTVGAGLLDHGAIQLLL